MKTQESGLQKYQLIVVKTLYFLAYSGFSAWLTYFYVYLGDVNEFSGIQIGVLASIQQLNSIYSPPIWGLMADMFGRKRMYLIGLLAIVILFYGFYISQSFIFYIGFVLVFSFFFDPVTPLLDNLALDTLSRNTKASFGEIRLWGSIGWAASTIVTGQFIEKDTLIYIFAIASSLLLVTWLISFFFYKEVKTDRKAEVLNIKDVKSLFRLDPRLNVLFAVMLVYGLVSAPIHMFVNLYYTSIGASYKQIGYAFAVQSIFELPFFFWGRRIIKWMGIERTLMFTMLITALRMLCYGLIPIPWVGIVVGATHGVGFALFFLAIVEYLHGFVPKHLQATGHSLIYSFYFGAGVGLGNLFTGRLKDWIGMQHAMLFQSGLIFILFLVLVILLTIEQRRLKRKKVVG